MDTVAIRVATGLHKAFSEPVPGAEACKALVSLATTLGMTGESLQGVRNMQLASTIGRLAQQVTAIAQPTADALAAAAAASREEECAALIDYVNAASFAVLGCGIIARGGSWGQWPPARDHLLKVLAAAKVVLVAGRQSLGVQLAAQRRRSSHSGAAPAAAAAQWHTRLTETAAAQLDAMQLLMGILASPQFAPQLARTFARAAAPPEVLLPWLEHISQTLVQASLHGPGAYDWIAGFVSPLSGLLANTVSVAAYERHQAEPAAPHSRALRQALVDAVLCCLPPLADAVEQRLGASADSSSSSSSEGGSRGDGSSSSSSMGASDTAAEQRSRTVAALTMLSNALVAGVMQQAFGQEQSALGSLLSGLKAGVRIALALPLDPPAGVPAQMLTLAHLSAAQCMSTTTDSLLQQPAIAAVWAERNAVYTQPAAAATAVAAGEEAGWQALRALPRLAVLLPRLAAALPGDSIVDWLVGHWASTMQLPHLLDDFSTAEQVVQWATAAGAALRLLPLVLSLGGTAEGQQQQQQQQQAGSQAGDEVLLEAAVELAEHLVTHVWFGGSGRLLGWSAQFAEDQQADRHSNEDRQQQQQQADASDSASALQAGTSDSHGTAPSRPLPAVPPPETAAQLYTLHTTACRVLACLAERTTPAPRWQLELYPDLAGGCYSVLSALRGMPGSTYDPVSERRYAGAYNAQLAALEPLLAAVAALPSDDGIHFRVSTLFIDLVAAAPQAACRLESEEWTAHARRAIDGIANAGNMPPDSRAYLLSQALQECCGRPRLLARLAAGGALAAACRHLLRLGLTGMEGLEMACSGFDVVRTLLENVLLAAVVLGAAEELASSGAGRAAGAAGGATAAQHGAARLKAEQLAAAASALQQAYDALPERCQASGTSLPNTAALFMPAAAAAARMASLLLEAWAAPEQQAAQQLELAQAAATRSCAYLRCANLSGEGGPFAGQGVDSKRCSACRAVWYCGTACSHADWRAGHKRVCKALATARQAEKEARQQQG